MKEANMNETPINPLIDRLVEKINEQTSDPVICPCCGGTEWKAARHLLLLPYFLDETADVAPDDPVYGAIRSLLLICSKCSYVRFHSVSFEAK
jgi:C4-type Zn-finger protein